MEFHMINMMYTALHMLAQTEKTTFTCKDDFLLTKRTRRWTYSALLYFLGWVQSQFELSLAQFSPSLFLFLLLVDFINGSYHLSIIGKDTFIQQLVITIYQHLLREQIIPVSRWDKNTH